MAETIRSLAAAFALMVPGVVAGTSCQDVRDAIAGVDARAGGVASLKDDTGITGVDGTDQAVLIANVLDNGGVYVVPAGVYQFNSAPANSIPTALTLRGAGPDSSVFKRNAASTAAVLSLTGGSLRLENLKFSTGGLWFDCNLLATTLPEIDIRNCVSDGIHTIVGWATTGPLVGSRINKLFVFGNWHKNSTRGLPNIDGHGASNVQIIGNCIEDVTRFGISVFGRETSQLENKNVRGIVIGNIVRGLTYASTNSNHLYISGKFWTTIGNHFHECNFNGVQAQQDFEGYYSKVENDILIGCTFFNAAGAAEGTIAFKGVGRAPRDSAGARGYNAICLGNILVMQGSQFTGPEFIWVQKDDCLISHCLLEGDGVNAGSGLLTQSASYKNIGFMFSHLVNIGRPWDFLADVPGSRVVGLVIERAAIGAGGRWRNQEATYRNIRLQDNLMFHTAAVTGTHEHHFLAQFDAAFTMGNILITGNIVDASNITAGTYGGIQFRGNGVVDKVLVANNIFHGFIDPTKILHRFIGNIAGVLRVTDSNLGFANWTKGSATVASGTSSVVVTHGLALPTGFDLSLDEWCIKITPTSGLHTAHCWRISATDSTTFTLQTLNNAQAAANVGANFTFDWEIYKREWSMV